MAGSQAGAADGYRTGIRARTPLLTRVLNSLVTADLNRGLNAALKPELVGRLRAGLKPAGVPGVRVADYNPSVGNLEAEQR